MSAIMAASVHTDNTFAKGEFPDSAWPLQEHPPVCRIPVFPLQPLVPGCPQSRAPTDHSQCLTSHQSLDFLPLLGLCSQFPFNLKWIFPILEGQGSAQTPFPLWSMPCNPFLASEAEFLSLLTLERSSVVPFLLLQHCWADSSYWDRQLTSPSPKSFSSPGTCQKFWVRTRDFRQRMLSCVPLLHCWGIWKWLNYSWAIHAEEEGLEIKPLKGRVEASQFNFLC